VKKGVPGYIEGKYHEIIDFGEGPGLGPKGKGPQKGRGKGSKTPLIRTVKRDEQTQRMKKREV